jgi:hypothetical protein
MTRRVPIATIAMTISEFSCVYDVVSDCKLIVLIKWGPVRAIFDLILGHFRAIFDQFWAIFQRFLTDFLTSGQFFYHWSKFDHLVVQISRPVYRPVTGIQVTLTCMTCYRSGI